MLKLVTIVALVLLPVALADTEADCKAATTCKACVGIMDGTNPACEFCAITGSHLGHCVLKDAACPAEFGGVATAKITGDDAHCTTDPANPQLCANCLKATDFGFCEVTDSKTTPKEGGCMSKSDADTKCKKDNYKFLDKCDNTGGAVSAVLPGSVLTAVVAYALLQ